MNPDEDWISQLRQIHDTDKARQQAKKASQAEARPIVTAEQRLQQCDAHALMRQVQKTLLDGGGKLAFYESVGGYDRAIVLMWAGPVSKASTPDGIEEVEASIIVSANSEGVFVNDKKLAEASPQVLRQGLLDVARELVAKLAS